MFPFLQVLSLDRPSTHNIIKTNSFWYCPLFVAVAFDGIIVVYTAIRSAAVWRETCAGVWSTSFSSAVVGVQIVSYFTVAIECGLCTSWILFFDVKHCIKQHTLHTSTTRVVSPLLHLVVLMRTRGTGTRTCEQFCLFLLRWTNRGCFLQGKVQQVGMECWALF